MERSDCYCTEADATLSGGYFRGKRWGRWLEATQLRPIKRTVDADVDRQLSQHVIPLLEAWP